MPDPVTDSTPATAAGGSHHHVEPLTTLHINAADFVGVEVRDPSPRPPRPTRRSILTQLEALPQTVFAGANRYDSEDGAWLHLWTADGQSFDIVWRHKS